MLKLNRVQSWTARFRSAGLASLTAVVAMLVLVGPLSADILTGLGEPDPDWNSGAMQLWMRADAGVENADGVAALDGETVQYWRDQSNAGYAAAQDTEGMRPLFIESGYNNQPSVVFDGADDMMTFGDILDQGTNSFTIFTVFSSPFREFTYNERILEKVEGLDKYVVSVFRSNHDRPGVYIYYGDGSSQTGAGPVGTDYTQLLNDKPHITASVVDYNNYMYQYVDGGTPAQADIWGLGPQENDADLTISAALGPWEGQVSEILMYTGALSSTELNAVGYYLQNKYDVDGTYVDPSGSLDGDLNSDGFVGGDDLDIVRSFWGQNVTSGDLLSGDPSKDGFVGGDDLDIVRANWGQGIPPGPSSIPEPGLLVFIVSGLLAMAAWRRRIH